RWSAGIASSHVLLSPPIRGDDDAGRRRLRLYQLQPGDGAIIAEKATARAEQQRMDEEQELVDQIVLEKCLHQLAAAKNDQVPVGIALQRRDRLRRFAAEQRRVLP